MWEFSFFNVVMFFLLCPVKTQGWKKGVKRRVVKKANEKDAAGGRRTHWVSALDSYRSPPLAAVAGKKNRFASMCNPPHSGCLGG